MSGSRVMADCAARLVHAAADLRGGMVAIKNHSLLFTADSTKEDMLYVLQVWIPGMVDGTIDGYNADLDAISAELKKARGGSN